MDNAKPGNSLNLTRSELTQCRRLSKADGLNGQRAKAILAIDEGNTQSVAASRSELSLGQVRYIISRFRLHRIKALQSDPVKPAVKEAAEKPKKSQSGKKKKNKKDNKKAKEKSGKKEKAKSNDKKKAKPDKKSKKQKKKANKSKK